MTAPRPISRRRWLTQSAGAIGAAAWAGCDGAGSAANRLRVFNWSAYIADGVLEQFEEETGASVVYDNYSSDAELEARLATGGGGYDVVFPSDRSLPALVAKDRLQPIDQARLANWKHLDPKFLSPPFDVGNRFTVPYFWGTLAVGVRSDHVPEEAAGFEPLFDARYRGRITMLDDPENVIAAVLLHLGLPMNSLDPGHLAQAKELLARQKPLVQAYTSDAYKDRLISGEAWVALGWSGDLLQAADESEEVRVIVPATGTLIWIDSLAIPRAARNVDLAHRFIDFLLRPEIAVKNAEAVYYATPNLTARGQLPAEMRDDPVIFPPPAVLDRCSWLASRGGEIVKVEAVWREVRE
ncbi:MAG: spermidine/putrescine ABC transporter substrate-binding protein [Pirellulaceae bacterium]|nr:spermidine/putrescine ABC transporter substrate-binding protein [Pirellulaceae bacterium]